MTLADLHRVSLRDTFTPRTVSSLTSLQADLLDHFTKTSDPYLLLPFRHLLCCSRQHQAASAENDRSKFRSGLRRTASSTFVDLVKVSDSLVESVLGVRCIVGQGGCSAVRIGVVKCVHFDVVIQCPPSRYTPSPNRDVVSPLPFQCPRLHHDVGRGDC